MKFLIGICIFAFLFSCSENSTNKKPNIIIIYVDDLGYGDVGCYGAKGVKTPNVDKLAKNGIRFTDAHCGAATCTPSRYTLLTGSYAFRNKAHILPGDAPLLIQPETPTLPKMLKNNGYKTACIGKWHLGLGNGIVDWNNKITPGPNEVGFNYSFIVPATGDRVPCVYVKNGQVVNLDKNDPITVSYNKKIGDWPTGLSNPELLKVKADTQHSCTIVNGISRIGYMAGGKTALWVDENTHEFLIKEAKKFINENKNNPFFLYFSLLDIHVPRAPNKKFIGKSSMGVRGDAIVEMDWCVGEIVSTLRKLNLENNTLIIFTSDNGPILDDGYFDKAEELVGNHKPAGPFRGSKYSAFEGGTRVPTITYWPNEIEPKVSSALWSQVDLYHSIATLIGYQLDTNEAPDSFDMLNAILGKDNIGREYLLEESFTLSIRSGNYKFISPFKGQLPQWMKNKNIEPALYNFNQLYNLNNDASEQNNLANESENMCNNLDNLIKKIEKLKVTR